MKQENKIINTICIDKDATLARSFEFTELLIQHSIALETTGGYMSFPNEKECPNRTITDMVRALYFIAGHSSPEKWCYAAKTAADIYSPTLHTILGISPFDLSHHHSPTHWPVLRLSH